MVPVYGESNLKIDMFSNFDFQSDVDDRKSIFELIFTCKGGVVSRKSSQQSTTTNSTIEAEYITAFDAAKKVV